MWRRIRRAIGTAAAVCAASALTAGAPHGEAGAQIWRPGTLDGRDVSFPVDTILERSGIHREALPGSIPQLPILRSIALAEVEGQSFARRPLIDYGRAERMIGAPGTTERRCVDVAAANARTIRAGDFLVGGAILQRSVGSDVFWSPLHDPMVEGDGLLVRMARIDSAAVPGDTVRHEQLRYSGTFGLQIRSRASPFQPHPLSDVRSQAVEPLFWSGLPVRNAGRWLVVATSGPDWGCLILTIPPR